MKPVTIRLDEDLVDALDDDRKPDTVWHQVVRPAILQVAAETDAVETSTNDQRYRWVGE